MRFLTQTSVFIMAVFVQAPSVSAQEKVFDDVVPRPTVSPYLNLLRSQGQSGLPTYYTLVRPQIEQRERAIRQQAEIRRLQGDVSEARLPLPTDVPAAAKTTGHPTYYMNYGHYYRGSNGRVGRR